MTQLHQLQLRFDPEQDRLLLRVNTKSQEEFRFWLSRRLIKLLWPALVKALSTNHQVSMQQDTAAREAVLSFQQEAARNEADYKTPYRESANTHPLGQEPLLVTQLQLRPEPKVGWVITLRPNKGEGIDLTLNEMMLHSFCGLLNETVNNKTDWDLELKLAVRSETRHGASECGRNINLQ